MCVLIFEILLRDQYLCCIELCVEAKAAKFLKWYLSCGLLYTLSATVQWLLLFDYITPTKNTDFRFQVMARLSYLLRHICTAKFSHQIRFTDYECKRFLGDVKSVFPSYIHS